MSFANKLRKAAFALPFAFALAANDGHAESLETGQCLPRADILAALAKDNQAPVITGNRILSENSNGNVFTSNPERTLGYNIEGDAPNGTPSKTVCVRAAYTNVRLNTMDNPILPAWFPKITNGHINIEKGYANGGRVLMLADTFVKDAKGTRQPGLKMSVIVLPSGAGAVDAISSTGAGQAVADLKSVQMTDHGRTLASVPTPSLAVVSLK